MRPSYRSLCSLSSLVAGQSRRLGKRFLLPILSILLLLSPRLAGVASAGVNTWTTNGPENGFISALAIDPATPATLYAGASGGGVFKSTNGGGSWTSINTGLTSTFVNALAIDPSAPATLYAGTDGGGVFKSTNGGGIWTVVNTGLTNTRVWALAINPSAPATLYAGTFGGGTVFKSTNGGGSWAAMNAGLIETVVWALAIDPSTPSTLYAGTYVGLFRSTNGGGSWSAINRDHIDSVFALAIDPSAPATLYSGWYDHGVFKSTNGGDSWATVNVGLPNIPIFALAIDPSAPATLYAGTNGGGVFKTTNGGESWTAMNAGLTNTDVYALAIDPSAPATLYAGTNGGGVFKSADAGVSSTLDLPVAGRVVGAGGTPFISDLRVVNEGDSPATVTLQFFASSASGQSGPTRSTSLTVSTGAQAVLDDVLFSTLGLDSALGALRVSSDQRLTVVERIFNDRRSSGGGTNGFSFAAKAPDQYASSGTLLFLSQASAAEMQSARGFRTNIGYFNPSSSAIEVTFRAVATSGDALGEVAVSIPAYSMVQKSAFALISAVPDSSRVQENFYVEYQASAPLLVYAAVVDNLTEDVVYVE